MGEVITEKDKEYEAQERAAAPGDDQAMADRVNNRSLRPNSDAFREFMKAGPTRIRISSRWNPPSSPPPAVRRSARPSPASAW